MSDYLKQIRALYSCDYERRLKVCKYCKTEFSDITKRNLRNTCSDECNFAAMVATRKTRGNYVQSEEHKRKIGESSRKMHASRDVYSVECRALMSARMKQTWLEGKIDTSKHWSKTFTGRQYLSVRQTGRKATLEARHHMSVAAQNRVRTKRETLYTSAKGGHRDDLGQYFRSSCEANFARILNFQGKTWAYEPTTFQLTETISYTPDFLCDGIFYEIKGRMTKRCHEQMRLMSELYPKTVVVLIDPQEYNKLRFMYKDVLKDSWEGK